MKFVPLFIITLLQVSGTLAQQANPLKGEWMPVRDGDTRVNNVKFVRYDGFASYVMTYNGQKALSAEMYPEFPGGDMAFESYITSNLKYPQQALDRGIEGNVICIFTVNTVGAISDVHILKGLGHGLDEEAKRLMLAMPAWKPATNYDKPISKRHIVSISFKIKSS